MSEPRSVFKVIGLESGESFVVARNWEEALKTWRKQQVLDGYASEVAMCDEPECIALLGDAVEAARK